MPHSTLMALNHSHSQLDHISNFKIDLMLVSTVAQHSRGLPFKPASSWRTEFWFPVLLPGWDLWGSVSPYAMPGSAVTLWRVRRGRRMFRWPCATQLPQENDWQQDRVGLTSCSGSCKQEGSLLRLEVKNECQVKAEKGISKRANMFIYISKMRDLLIFLGKFRFPSEQTST